VAGLQCHMTNRCSQTAVKKGDQGPWVRGAQGLGNSRGGGTAAPRGNRAASEIG
jgi:hypothetical protein